MDHFLDDVNYKATGFFNNFVNNKGVACIKSSMGTGKTKCLITNYR